MQMKLPYRLKEAQKLGFTNAIIPNSFSDKKQKIIKEEFERMILERSAAWC